MSIAKERNIRIEERKGKACVLFEGDHGRVIIGERDRTGRIRWSQPECVPRAIKNIIAPQLFAAFDRQKWGI